MGSQRQDRSRTRSRDIERRRKDLVKKIDKFGEKHNLHEKVTTIMGNMHPSDVKKVLEVEFPRVVRSANAFVISIIRKLEAKAGRQSGYRWDGKTWDVSSPSQWARSSRSRSGGSSSGSHGRKVAETKAPWRSPRPARRWMASRSRSASESHPRSADRTSQPQSHDWGGSRSASRGRMRSPVRQRSLQEKLPQRPAPEAADRSRLRDTKPLPRQRKSAKSSIEQKDCSMTLEVRARLKRFFDGTSLPGVLVEGSAVIQVPDVVAPMLLNGYPHGFPNLSVEDGMTLLNIISAFVDCGNGHGGREAADGANAPSLGTEVRQAVVVDTTGRRSLTKTLLINGTVASSEQHPI